MSIDWMNPSDDVVEAKRIGYEEGLAEAEEQIASLNTGLADHERMLDIVESDLAAEREAHAATKAELERLRREAVKRERAYLEAALLAPEEQAESEWQVCGSTWTVYAEEIVKDQAKDIARLQAIVDRLNDNDLADRVMVRCHDPAHDERWCGTGEGIDAYRAAVLNAAAAKEK